MMFRRTHNVSSPVLSTIQSGLTPCALWDQLSYPTATSICYPTATSSCHGEKDLLEDGCGNQPHPRQLMLLAVGMQVGPSNGLTGDCCAGLWPMKLLLLTHFLFST